MIRNTNRCHGRYALGAVALCLALAGCNNTTTTSSSTATPTAGKQRRVAAILMQDDQFFRLTEVGLKESARKNNIEFVSASSSGALDKEINLVDTYITRGVDAIIVAPISPKGSIPALKRAADKGIKIVSWISVDQPFISAVVRNDDTVLGKSTGRITREYIQKKMGGKANIAMLEFVGQLADVGKLRPDGFKSELQKLPGVHIVAEQDAWTPALADRVTSDILNAHPEVNIIYAANEGATIGATTAIKNAGKAGKVVVFGTDISDQIATFLLANDGILQAVTGQKPYEMGVRTMDTAVQVLDGKPVPKLQVLDSKVFTRDKPEEIKAYQKQVATYTADSKS